MNEWTETKLNIKKVDVVMANKPVLHGDIWRLCEVWTLGLFALNSPEERLTLLEKHRVIILFPIFLKSSSLGCIVAPSWSLTVPLFPLAFTLFYLRVCWFVWRQSCYPFRRPWLVPKLLSPQASLVLISSVTLNKWFDFMISICITCKMESLLVPSEELMSYHNDSKQPSTSALMLIQQM